jgi:hypothetical protein
MHAKMLLFALDDGTAELWVGSHNWTNRALLGLNVEASLVVHLRESSPLFRAATDYLANIRKISDRFDPAKAGFYKDVQRNMSERVTPVIEVTSEDGRQLAGSTIEIFGTDVVELDRIGDVRREVHVSVLDAGGEAQHLYRRRSCTPATQNLPPHAFLWIANFTRLRCP